MAVKGSLSHCSSAHAPVLDSLLPMQRINVLINDIGNQAEHYPNYQALTPRTWCGYKEGNWGNTVINLAGKPELQEQNIGIIRGYRKGERTQSDEG